MYLENKMLAVKYGYFKIGMNIVNVDFNSISSLQFSYLCALCNSAYCILHTECFTVLISKTVR